MPLYLITLSIGPVQDFIAAARRTRDLWMGSYLLSEIAKAAAKALYEANGKDKNTLIFPAVLDNTESKLNPCPDPENCFNVGNKLLALVETDKPEDIVQKAKEATQSRWEQIAEKAREKAEKQHIKFDDDIWQKQINDVLEVFSAWVLFDTEKDDYKAKRARLDALLNARKNTRDFLPNLVDGDGIPKSSLDGLRENLIDTDDADDWHLLRLGIKRNEYLDVTGVAKRIGGNPEQFTPLSRVAIDPWLRGLPDNENLESIKGLLNELVHFGICTPVKSETYKKLPYDGQLLYSARIEIEKKQIQETSRATDKNQVIELLERLESEVKSLYKKHGEPQAYLAILHADGDNMGKLLDSMQTLENHQAISAALSRFSQKVPEIVEKYHGQHYGHCVYAGGDDVLALLPLDQAIACSKVLADTFKEILSQIDGISDNKIPTLSVGLGVSHFLTPMPKQLDLARRAEALAKSNELPAEESKNALAIILKPRSGAEISFRERWDNEADSVLGRWIEAHLDEAIPRQAGYHLRDESIALDWQQKPDKYDVLVNAETRRILGKKRVEDADGDNKELDAEWIDAICGRAEQRGLRNTADELIMTYRISHAYKQADKTKQEGTTDA